MIRSRDVNWDTEEVEDSRRLYFTFFQYVEVQVIHMVKPLLAQSRDFIFIYFIINKCHLFLHHSCLKTSSNIS